MSKLTKGKCQADTTSNIAIAKGEWRDLYALSGITIGVQIEVINVGNSECRLYAGATAPSQANQGIPLPVYRSGLNETGDAGAWIYSIANARVNVREL